MVMFEAFEEGIQVNGTTILSIADALNRLKFLVDRYFTRVGLPTRTEIEKRKDDWFPQQKWLEAFKLIYQNIGNLTLQKIGRKIPENAVLPPEIDNVEKSLSAIDVAYHMNHRNKKGEVLFDPTREDNPMLEGIGHYHYEKPTDDNVAILNCDNPYPCDFDKGIIMSMALRFAETAKVAHDDTKPCRKEGANSCTYTVAW